MMRVRATIVFLVIAGASISALGQPCTELMTPQQCFDQFLTPPKPLTPESAQPVVDDANKKMATANTGVTNLVSPSSSALRDFLALFAASVESATLKQSSNALTLDWNLPFPLLGDGRPVKIQAVMTKPELNSELVKALGTNTAAIDTLNGTLKDGGDFVGSVTINPVNTMFGRAMGPHRFLLAAAMNAVQSNSTDKQLADFGDLVIKTDLDPGKPFKDQPNIPKPLLGSVVTAVEERARALKADAAALQNVAINPFLKLLNNQPQFYATGLVHSRDDLVGPNESSGKLTLEISFAPNLNAFYRGVGRECVPESLRPELTGGGAGVKSKACLTALNAFAASADNRASATQSRLSVAAEYKEVSATNINLPQLTTPFQKKGSHSFVASGVYGYVINGQEDPTKADRIDITFSYENVSGDPLKKDRGVGSITFTKKISDTMTLPISLVYANHAQFLSNVDRKLNVHFGLVYKMPK